MNAILQCSGPEGDTRDYPLNGDVASLGRGRQSLIEMHGWRVAKEHARLQWSAEGWSIEDQGTLSGTYVNGARIVRYGPLTFADQIRVGPYVLRLREPEQEGGARRLHEPHHPRPVSVAAPHQPAPTAPREAREAVAAATSVERPATPDEDPLANAAVTARHPWRQRIHEQLLETIDLRRRDLTRMSDAELRSETEKLVREILSNLRELPADIDKEALRKEVLDEAVGLGPLEDLLEDPSVTEVMVNRTDEIFVERGGRLQRYPLAFTSDRAVLGVIERIVAPLGRRIDESSPLVDARLKDGSRVNAIIPPLALKGPTITIRKFSKKRLTADDLAGYGSVSQPMVEFLELCVRQRKNMIVSGGTGSGKTTLLNVLSNFIPNGERIITIEDAAELRLNHSHLVSLESRPSNAEGRGAITIRELVKNSLRMRPDRIVVGECRGGEALDMLQAMNTGHEGSLTTLHANTPRDALARLETLVLMAGMELPIGAIRDQINSAVDIIVQQSRFACGSRKVTSITEITGMENGRIQMQELFRFEPRGFGADGKVVGDFVGCDAIPSFYDELREQGISFDLSLFNRRAA